MKKILAVSATLLAIFTAVAIPSWGRTIFYSEPIEFGGVIRPDAEGNWHLLEDKDHRAFNLGTVTQTSEYLRVELLESVDIINWVSITPDETLVTNDVDTGASVNKDNIKIFFAKNGKQIAPSTFRDEGSNVWIYARAEMSNEDFR